MSPQERKEFEELKKRVMVLERVENVSFIENLKLRLTKIIRTEIINTDLGDLRNVNDAGITDGQILKWNNTQNKYLPANDNTA